MTRERADAAAADPAGAMADPAPAATNSVRPTAGPVRPAAGSVRPTADPVARSVGTVRAAQDAGRPRPLSHQPNPRVVRSAPLLNAANALTVLRLALVPVFVVVLLHSDGHRAGWRILACGIFAAASLTDRVDGSVARAWGLVTDFGKVADPIADKALIGSALVGLSLLGDLPWVVTVVVLAREVGVTLLRFWVIRHGVIPASRGGKLKTALQGLALGLYVLPLPSYLVPIRVGLMAAAVAVTVATGGDYIARALRLRRTSERAVGRRAARR